MSDGAQGAFAEEIVVLVLCRIAAILSIRMYLVHEAHFEIKKLSAN
jgi:hypothetical protein